MLAKAVTPALKSGELPATFKKSVKSQNEKTDMKEDGCPVSLLSRLTRGSADLASTEAESGSHFLYFSTGTKKETIKLLFFSSTAREYTTAALLMFQKNN